MSDLKLSEAAGKVIRLSMDDLKGVAKRLLGAIPKGRRPDLQAAITSALQQEATGDGENAVVSDLAANALAGVGDEKPVPKKPEAAPDPTPEPEKPTKAKQEKAIKLPKQPKPAKEPKPRDKRLPAPGSTITKVWRDRKLEVVVNEADFTFDGKTYRSLSKIASELQGCPSNGFLFFGLTEGAKAAAARRAEREAAKAATETAKAETPKPEKKAKATKQAKAKGSKKKASKK